MLKSHLLSIHYHCHTAIHLFFKSPDVFEQRTHTSNCEIAVSSLVILVLSLMNCSRSSISLSGWSSWRSLRILFVPGLPPEHLVNILHRLDPVLKDARLRFSCLNLSEESKSFTRMLWSSRAAKRRAVLPPPDPSQARPEEQINVPRLDAAASQ